LCLFLFCYFEMDEFFIVQSTFSFSLSFPSFPLSLMQCFRQWLPVVGLFRKCLQCNWNRSPSSTVKRKLRNCSQFVWHSFNWSLIGTPEIDPQAKQPNGTTLERLRQKIKIHSWKQRSDQQNNLAANKSMLCIGSL